MSAPSSDRSAVKRIMLALRERGATLVKVDDGGDLIDVNDSVTEALDAVMAVDSAHLFVSLPDGTRGYVLFVLGNSPEEVAADYTTNLSDLIEPLTNEWF